MLKTKGILFNASDRTVEKHVSAKENSSKLEIKNTSYDSFTLWPRVDSRLS